MGISLFGTKGDGVSAHGRLRVSDGKLVDKHNKPVQLRGFSTHGITWYPEYANSEAFRWIVEKGGNVVRIAMYTDGDSGYVKDPQNVTDLVIQSIECALEEDIYVIVDWHILEDGDPNTYVDQAVEFFTQIASTYRKEPGIIYEICNEPNNVEWSDIKKYAEVVCPVIRKYSPKAVIIVGTPDYSSDLYSPMTEALPYDNIMYAFHYYAGMHPESRYIQGLAKAAEKQLPVFVSEWGVSLNSEKTPAIEEGGKFADYLNAAGISWCAWSLCNKDEVFSVIRSDCSSTGPWNTDELTDVGNMLVTKLTGIDK